jgi:hypothetical protein
MTPSDAVLSLYASCYARPLSRTFAYRPNDSGLPGRFIKGKPFQLAPSPPRGRQLDLLSIGASVGGKGPRPPRPRTSDQQNRNPNRNVSVSRSGCETLSNTGLGRHDRYTNRNQNRNVSVKKTETETPRVLGFGFGVGRYTGGNPFRGYYRLPPVVSGFPLSMAPDCAKLRDLGRTVISTKSLEVA